MIKNVKRIALIIVCICLLSGCVKSNIEMEIKKDKSMTVSLITAIADEYLNMMTEDDNSNFGMDNAQIELYREMGYLVEEIKKDGYTGYKVIKKVKNIDELSSTEEATEDISNIFEENAQKQYYFLVKKGFFKNKYKAVFKIDNNDYTNLANEYEDADIDYEEFASEYNELIKSMEYRFILNLPTKPISNNADEESSNGKVLVWDLNKENAKETIEFEFELINRGATYTSMIAVVLILLIVIIDLFNNPNKKETVVPIKVDKDSLNSDEIGEVDLLGNNMNNKIREDASI